MIDGLKVRMTSGELAVRLSERIAWHERAAAECEAECRRTGSRREDPVVPELMIEHEMREHREQAGVLQMLRDHLVPDEVYQLSEMDLRFADLVPDFHVEYSLPSPRADAGGSDRGPRLEV